MNNIKIEVLSPLHIGDNENKNLSSLSDFIVDGDKIKLIDHQKLESIFSENPHIMEDYIKEIKTHSQQKFSLKSFLQKYKISIEEITESESIPFIGQFNGKEIHPFISENGKKYLPGSSVKGAIRNALAFVYLKEHPKIIEKVLERNFPHFKTNKTPQFYEDKQIFGKDPFNDILKFLQVSDSVTFSENSTAVYGCQNFHLKKQSQNSIPINYECIKPNSETKIRIKIKEIVKLERLQIKDKTFWKENLTIPKMFASLNLLSQRFIEREIKELSSVKEMQPTIIFYKNLLNEIENSTNETAWFCLGKGTTIMEKTILLAFSDEELKKLRNKMKNTKASRNFGWKKVNGESKASNKLPVTRLVYHNKNNWQAGFGWLKMEVK